MNKPKRVATVGCEPGVPNYWALKTGTQCEDGRIRNRALQYQREIRRLERQLKEKKREQQLFLDLVRSGIFLAPPFVKEG